MTVDPQQHRTRSGGDAEGDTYLNLEEVFGSACSTTIWPHRRPAYLLQGGAGNDTFVVGQPTGASAWWKPRAGAPMRCRPASPCFSIASYANVEKLT